VGVMISLIALAVRFVDGKINAHSVPIGEVP
jgi:hypothetical protein